MKRDDKLFDACYDRALSLLDKGYPVGDMGLFELTRLIYKLELEKIEKNAKTDALLPYNDEIESIDFVGDRETIDISVSGDNLFYCNSILTKNSFGLPATADLMLALSTTEELEKMGQILIKQLKNRYNDVSKLRRFVVGIDRSKMRLFDLEASAQKDLVDINASSSSSEDDSPVFDKTKFGSSVQIKNDDFDW